MAVAMKARGHEVTVVVGGAGMYVDILRERNLPVVSIPNLTRGVSPTGEVAAYHEIKAALSEIRPDIVSTHSSKAGILGRMAAHKLGIPSIFTAHGWSFTQGLPVRQRIPAIIAERIAARYGNLVITVSNHDRELAMRYSIDRPDRVVAIHNGMPDNAPEYRANHDAEVPRLIMIARFEPQKDHATLISALADLRHLPWTLDLIGDGHGRAAVEERLRTLGLDNRVRLVGYSGDVATLLSQSQVFLLISDWEGLPRSILEAMRAGLPVVATDVGGVSESVEDGVTGFVVPRRSVNSLKQALHQILYDANVRRVMGRLGRARYEQHFTFERMFEETLAAYHRVLKEQLVRMPDSRAAA
jgi:glycosyltransferase involved in cell wall biosynthesis